MSSSFFSQGLENVLAMLRARSRGRSSFPRGWTLDNSRAGATVTIQEWFKHCIDNHLQGHVDRCQVEEDLAIFAVLAWRGSTITYINCQALVVLDGSLEAYYLDYAKKAQYLRLDFDLSALGSMFREPAPHVHVHPDGEPRFLLSNGGNVLMDFFDFIYRNYRYADWLSWAESVWRREAPVRGLAPEALERVKEAFERSNCDALKPLSKELHHMKHAWRSKKDELWPYKVPALETSLLSYEPTALPAPREQTPMPA